MFTDHKRFDLEQKIACSVQVPHIDGEQEPDKYNIGLHMSQISDDFHRRSFYAFVLWKIWQFFQESKVDQTWRSKRKLKGTLSVKRQKNIK